MFENNQPKSKRREHVDFHRIAEQHQQIHMRLENWARWSHGRTGRSVAPGFELYRSPAYARSEYGHATGTAVDADDAVRIAKGVAALPQLHRLALVWCYVTKDGPGRARKRLATTMAGLAQLVHDGRQMLVNRGA